MPTGRALSTPLKCVDRGRAVPTGHLTHRRLPMNQPCQATCSARARARGCAGRNRSVAARPPVNSAAFCLQRVYSAPASPHRREAAVPRQKVQHESRRQVRGTDLRQACGGAWGRFGRDAPGGRADLARGGPRDRLQRRSPAGGIPLALHTSPSSNLRATMGPCASSAKCDCSRVSVVPGVLLPMTTSPDSPCPDLPDAAHRAHVGEHSGVRHSASPPFACSGQSVRPVHGSGSVPGPLPRPRSDPQTAVAEPQRKRSLVGPYPLRREPPDGLPGGTGSWRGRRSGPGSG